MRLIIALMVLALAAPAVAGRDATLTPFEPVTQDMPPVDVVYGNPYGDCSGCYGNWWEGSESYALRVDPRDQGYAYTPGTTEFRVENIHMQLWLESSCNLPVQARLLKGADLDMDGFDEPDETHVYGVSAPIQVSGIEGWIDSYDILVPCDFESASLFRTYFLVFDFLDSEANYCGLPICSECDCGQMYNGVEGAWTDLIGEVGLIGSMFIWAEVMLVDGAVPQGDATWGGVKTMFR